MSIMDHKLRNRTEMFLTRLMELAEVLPRGMEGQAVGIELRSAGSAFESACRAALASRTPEEYQRRIGSLRNAAAECVRWMQLINNARLVQSPRLDELLMEGSGLLTALEVQRKPRASDAVRRRVEPARPARSSRPARPARAGVAA